MDAKEKNGYWSTKLLHMSSLNQVLEKAVTLTLEEACRFFKTKPGDYAEKEVFLGIRTPKLHEIAKEYLFLDQNHLKALITSPINEKRLLAILILKKKYEKTKDLQEKEKIFSFSLKYIQSINNWNLVDCFAPSIFGAYLWDKGDKGDKEKKILFEMALSKNLWFRRIAIVSTLFFVRKKETTHTYQIALMLLSDSEDLMQKAVGWLLREAGKQNEKELKAFLKKHHNQLSRTTLRYAIEKFP